MIQWWRTSFGEEEVERLRSSVLAEHVSQGPVTAEFERKFAEMMDMPFAVATTSGSVALLMSLMAIGFGQDDEVIIPNRTWIANAHAPMLVGGNAILVDVRPDVPIIDVSLIEAKLTSRTKAIMPVHLNGRAVDMAAVNALAKRYGLFVIEDACQAMFSRNSSGFLGTQSDIGCFSLGPTKLVSSGQGGMAVTRSAEIYEKLKLIRNHGVKDIFAETWNQLGFNFKFNDLLASFGLVQLSRATKRIAHLRELYAQYAVGLAGLSFLNLIPVAVENGEVPLYVEALSSRREEINQFMKSHEIQLRIFSPNLSVSPYIDNDGHYPNSQRYARQGFCLPCGPDQAPGNIERVVEMLRLIERSM